MSLWVSPIELNKAVAGFFSVTICLSPLVLIRNPESGQSETETGPSKQASESETRSGGFESETNLQYHNTGLRPHMTINQWTSKLLRD